MFGWNDEEEEEESRVESGRGSCVGAEQGVQEVAACAWRGEEHGEAWGTRCDQV